jgi:hypothetical protein
MPEFSDLGRVLQAWSAKESPHRNEWVIMGRWNHEIQNDCEVPVHIKVPSAKRDYNFAMK